MKYLSLFSGIGGFELGIKQVYESNILIRNGKTENKNSNSLEQSMESAPTSDEYSGSISDDFSGRDTGSILDIGRPHCVGYSEIDKYATQIYQSHFPEHKNYGDITKINEKELPDFDLLVGGFPCQSFSIAGKRKGFEDTRGTMFFEIARILRAKQPRLLLLENVKGLLSHDNGKTFAIIIATLDELGYDTQWQVLNSKDFGVPQNRERVFIVGHLRGTPRPEVFPFTGTNKENNSKNYSNAIDANYWKGIDNHGQRTAIAVAPTIRATQYKSGDNQTIVAEQGIKIRRLTPVECERLQGFPDNWTKYGIEKKIVNELYDISDTQRYKCLGNAVTVNVVREITKKLINPKEPL